MGEGGQGAAWRPASRWSNHVRGVCREAYARRAGNEGWQGGAGRRGRRGACSRRRPDGRLRLRAGRRSFVPASHVADQLGDGRSALARETHPLLCECTAAGAERLAQGFIGEYALQARRRAARCASLSTICTALRLGQLGPTWRGPSVRDDRPARRRARAREACPCARVGAGAPVGETRRHVANSRWHRRAPAPEARPVNDNACETPAAGGGRAPRLAPRRRERPGAPRAGAAARRGPRSSSHRGARRSRAPRRAPPRTSSRTGPMIDGARGPFTLRLVRRGQVGEHRRDRHPTAWAAIDGKPATGRGSPPSRNCRARGCDHVDQRLPAASRPTTLPRQSPPAAPRVGVLVQGLSRRGIRALRSVESTGRTNSGDRHGTPYAKAE